MHPLGCKGVAEGERGDKTQRGRRWKWVHGSERHSLKALALRFKRKEIDRHSMNVPPPWVAAVSRSSLAADTESAGRPLWHRLDACDWCEGWNLGHQPWRWCESLSWWAAAAVVQVACDVSYNSLWRFIQQLAVYNTNTAQPHHASKQAATRVSYTFPPLFPLGIIKRRYLFFSNSSWCSLHIPFDHNLRDMCFHGQPQSVRSPVCDTWDVRPKTVPPALAKCYPLNSLWHDE